MSYMINLLDRAGEEEELSLIFFVIKTLLRNIKLVFGINCFFLPMSLVLGPIILFTDPNGLQFSGNLCKYLVVSVLKFLTSPAV